MENFPDTLHREFHTPPREFGMVPDWFWSDDPDDEEIRRQLGEFHRMGFAGVMIFPGIGLSGRVGYLSPEWFQVIGGTLEEAERLGMKVLIWDDGGYPSGSANGLVARENPEHLIHVLVCVDKRVEGPAVGYWLPSTGPAVDDRLLQVFLAREDASGVLDRDSIRQVESLEHDLVRYEVGPETWRLIACWDIESGARMRGYTPQEEDGRALAPAAASLIHPGAVESFIRHTHEQYYAHLREHFGKTLVGFFTDEPTLCGRGSTWRGSSEPYPFHPDLLNDLREEWDEDVLPWLPALWYDCGPRTAAFRLAYDHALQKRLSRVYYARLSRWCEEHGVMLAGHPGGAGDLNHLRHFHIPGQDMVVRYVCPPGRESPEVEWFMGRERKPAQVWHPTPELPSALAGPQSVVPKGASSAALIDDRRRNSSELFGCYGWQMTLDEAKWLFDWHLVRGNNLFLPGIYYSIRGRRAHLWGGPCAGPNNVWWPTFGVVADYVHRLCWLLTDGHPVCDVAVLTDQTFVKWDAAMELFRAQIDFFYLYDEPLQEARIEDGRLVIGQGRFRAVVCDPESVLTPAVRAKLEAFRAAGGVVVESWEVGTLASRLTPALGQDLRVEGQPAQDLRATHYRKGDWDLYVLVNEGDELIERRVSLAVKGALELWDPMDGSTRPWRAHFSDGRLQTEVRLERRQGLVLAVNPVGQPEANAECPLVPGDVALALLGPWRAMDGDGNAVDVPCPADWAKTAGWELFSGTLTFRTEFGLPPVLAGEPLFLDLGQVGDIADVRLNGQSLGVRAWAPYVLPMGQAARPGANTIEVRVTNSMANSIQGMQLPSGLLGEVCVRTARPWALGATLQEEHATDSGGEQPR